MSDGTHRRRTEITIERRRVVVISRTPISIGAWCPECLRETTWITADEAAAFCGVAARSVYRAVEDGSIHFSQNTDGLLWLCIESLARKGWNE